MFGNYLNSNSADQLMYLLIKFKEYDRLGFGVQDAYRQSVSKTSNKYGVTYQTIGDLCRRRLALENIYQFYDVLQDWIDGDPSSLKNLIGKHVSSSDQIRINELLLNGKSEVNDDIRDEPKEFDSFRLSLDKNMVKHLPLHHNYLKISLFYLMVNMLMMILL